MSKLYLGHLLDDAGETTEDRFEAKADRLTSHAVCIGMTGSGKTGLSVTLLEELVLQGVPIIAIDPKGDLANLGLVFPQLQGADFTPWVDPGEAERSGQSVDAVGQAKAELWRGGLAGSGIDGARLQQLADKMQLRVFTPGSESGIPVDLLGSLQAPPPAIREDPDAWREMVAGTVSGLLALMGVEADPVRSPEHLVMQRILEEAWSAGETLDMEQLVLRIVDPPFKKVGVFPVDRFWKPDKRMDLAMALNGVVSAPAFGAWTKGAQLDAQALVRGDGGKVPVNVFYLAHLADAERMFFVSLLLERVVAWSRTLPGTGSLRALVFFDEAYGYLPPYPRNPPTRKPLMTLLKQARAVGVGVMLATQNPVDLDYKALTNAGTWYLGRLSTEQDINRVAEGMRAAGAAGDLSGMLARLKPRRFVVRDVRESQPVAYKTRWAMSFLRGPITRREIARLPDSVRTVGGGLAAAPAPPPGRPHRSPRRPPADPGRRPPGADGRRRHEPPARRGADRHDDVLRRSPHRLRGATGGHVRSVPGAPPTRRPAALQAGRVGPRRPAVRRDEGRLHARRGAPRRPVPAGRRGRR